MADRGLIVMAAIETANRILGVDPGLNITGYAVVERRLGRLALVEAGMIRGRSRGDLAARLHEIHEGLADVIATLKPDVLSLEELYSHYERPRTAILMGHARGVILLVAQRHGLAIHEFAANRVKQSLTGHGHAGKAQMQRAIMAVWNLAEPPEPPDVADALAIALCCGRSLG